jgi:hypothetical protein
MGELVLDNKVNPNDGLLMKVFDDLDGVHNCHGTNLELMSASHYASVSPIGSSAWLVQPGPLHRPAVWG